MDIRVIEDKRNGKAEYSVQTCRHGCWIEEYVSKSFKKSKAYAKALNRQNNYKIVWESGNEYE